MHQNDAVSSQKFVLARFEYSTGLTVLIDYQTAKAKIGYAALVESHLRQPELPAMDSTGKVAAIFASHRSLHVFDNGIREIGRVVERLGAVADGNSPRLAQKFVVRALVGVLKAAPTAHVKYEDRTEPVASGLNVGDQPFESVSFSHGNAGPRRIGISAYNLDVVASGVFGDDLLLVLDGELLETCRCPDILSGPHVGLTGRCLLSFETPSYQGACPCSLQNGRDAALCFQPNA